jgi:nicotinamide riboside kinase
VHAGKVNRVAIVGPVASGKTTVAARLGSRLGLPVLDLDEFYWRQSPLPTDEEWAARHRELIRPDQWIISGDYRAVADARFSAADAVVWLDLPRSTCLYRATLRKLTGDPSPLIDCWRWIWRYKNNGRHDTATSLANPHLTCTIFRLRSPGDVTSFLTEFAD